MGDMKNVHDLKRLDLNLLVIFDALIRERSVTRAAISLDLTQSAMSHSLARLREYFDDRLFIKSQGGIAPTPKAAALSPVVIEVMVMLREQLLSQTRFEPSTAKRSFTFCMTDMGELVFLPMLVSRFKEEAPHCAIHTLQTPASQLPAVLGSGEADLAMGSIRSAPEGLFQQELFTHTFVCIVSARNPDIQDSMTLDQFKHAPHVVVSLTGRDNLPYDSAIEDAGIMRNIKVRTPHFLVVPLLLDQHPEFIATVPRSLGMVFARNGMVRVIEPPLQLPTFALRQYWHPRFHHDRAIIWLRDLVNTTFAELPASMR